VAAACMRVAVPPHSWWHAQLPPPARTFCCAADLPSTSLMSFSKPRSTSSSRVIQRLKDSDDSPIHAISYSYDLFFFRRPTILSSCRGWPSIIQICRPSRIQRGVWRGWGALGRQTGAKDGEDRGMSHATSQQSAALPGPGSACCARQWPTTASETSLSPTPPCWCPLVPGTPQRPPSLNSVSLSELD